MNPLELLNGRNGNGLHAEVPPVAAGHLSASAGALLDHADDTPQSAKALTRKAGYTYGSHIREALAELVRSRLLVHTPDGYIRGDGKAPASNPLTRPLPPGSVGHALAAFARLLDQLGGGELRVRVEGFELVGLVLHCGEPLDSTPSEQPTNIPSDLSDVETALLAVATAEPQTGKALARKAGYAWSSYVRTALTTLVRRGFLIRTTGYRLPITPEPPP